MTCQCYGLRHPVLRLILAATLLTLTLSSLPPPKENFRKVEKRILDKLFSPEVYDNRMRPKGKPSKVKKALPHVHKCTEIDTFSVLCSANILVVSGSQQQYRWLRSSHSGDRFSVYEEFRENRWCQDGIQCPDHFPATVVRQQARVWWYGGQDQVPHNDRQLQSLDAGHVL